MPDVQSSRSRKYAAKVAQALSIEEHSNSPTSSSVDNPTSTRTRNRSRSVQTRIVTTHVDGSVTNVNVTPRRSPIRLPGVRARVHRGAAPATEPTAPQLRLLNGFELAICGRSLVFAANTQRLIAYLALHERPQSRSAVAGSLWIDRSEQRAAANLRTALWKLGTTGRRLVTARGNLLALSADVEIDFRTTVRQARELVHRDVNLSRQVPVDVASAMNLFTGDLLPDWDEDWILFERERLRQLRMHAIEALSRLCANSGRYAEAVDAGIAAVAADSLRESAHRVLIEAFLGEGNVADARRQFDQFRGVLWDSLRLRPSAELAGLVGAT